MKNFINKYLTELYEKEIRRKIDVFNSVLKECPELDPDSKKFDKKIFLRMQLFLLMME